MTANLGTGSSDVPSRVFEAVDIHVVVDTAEIRHGPHTRTAKGGKKGVVPHVGRILRLMGRSRRIVGVRLQTTGGVMQQMD